MSWTWPLFDWGLIFKLDMVLGLARMTKVKIMLGKDIREATKFFYDSLSILQEEDRNQSFSHDSLPLLAE